MNSKNPGTTRRSLLKGLVAIPVVAAGGYQSIAAAQMLSLDHPTAKTLQYTEKTPIPAETCANCKLYLGGNQATGVCPIFGTFEVVAEGWCKSWVAR